MTKWSEMSPRERDALVAMKVMGWEVVRGTVIPPGYDSWSKPNVPHYTTDIAAAWEVVEKMRSMRGTDEDVYFTFYDNATMSIYAITPERICLAALRAVGVNVEY